MTIGDRIKQLCTENNISAKKLSENVDVSATIVGKYLRNESIPSAAVLGKIAEFFNVTTDYIVFGDNDDIEYIKKRLLDVFDELNEKNRLQVIKEATGLLEVQRIENMNKRS